MTIAVKLSLILFQFSLVPLKLRPVVCQLPAVLLNLTAAGAVAQVLPKLTPVPVQFTAIVAKFFSIVLNFSTIVSDLIAAFMAPPTMPIPIGTSRDSRADQ
ncbi:MAG TPA: hypothetical protein VFQ03_05205 [Candidatus Binatia bacterium]|nr:hypothetical protein [Candidatus Binatia bacterium]